MRFDYTPEELAYQQRIRDFIAEHDSPELQTGISHMMGGGEDDEEATARLNAGLDAFRDELDRAGLLRVAWPEELGGQGLSPIYQYIQTQELERAGLMPRGVPMTAAVISRFGTEEQKDTLLEGLLSRKIKGCAGYSEPRGGTDLASLETRAVRDGDEWVINGQKVYCSGAHVATHMWCLVRTDPDAPKHDGISIFMIDMKTPGITVRPLWTMGTHRTNEVFLDNVRVPASALIGDENKGWRQNSVALDLERVHIGSYAPYQRFFDEVVAFVKETEVDGKPLADDPTVRLRLGELAVDIEMCRHISEKNAWMIASGQVPTMEASMAKVWSTELYTHLTSAVMNLLGPLGQLKKGSKWVLLGGEVEAGYLNSPPPRFGGGANEVMRDMIARRGLGLPRAR